MSPKQRATSREMIFVAPRPGIVGSQKARRTVAIQQLAEIGSTGQYVVVRVIWIVGEALAGTQSSPRLRHDLHQVHGPLGDRARTSPKLSTCMMARTHDAGMLNRCDAAATIVLTGRHIDCQPRGEVDIRPAAG